MDRVFPQTTHASEHRLTFWTVLARFGDAKIRQAGGKTFGATPLVKPVRDPNSMDSVLFGPYVLQLVNGCFRMSK